MDTEEPGYVDPADQWVLDPVTGLYELRLDVPSGSRPAQTPEPAPTPAPAPAPVRSTPRSGHGGRRAAAPAAPSRRRRAASRRRRPSALVWGVAATCGVLVAGVTAGVVVLRHGGGAAVHTVDIGSAGVKDPVHAGAMNVLLLGSRPTDTAVVLHLAADRGNMTALGIPAAMAADIPDCPAGGGTVKGAKQQPFSAALTGRGPGCALRVAEQVTGLPVDHVVLVDYAAAKAASSGVAAADLCVNRTVADPRTLADLARNAPSALTTDAPLGSAKALGALADAMGAADPRHVTFVTVPLLAGAAPQAADAQKASQLYALLAHDVSLSPDRPAAADPKLVGPKATPHNTRVEVYNGTGVFGASQDVLAWLQNSKGVNRSTNGGDAHGKAPRTTLQYAPNQADQARSLAAMMGLPASALIPGTKDAAPRANMVLTLGADFTAPGVPVGPPTAPPKGVVLTPAADVHC